MKKIAAFLATGFEEVEALAVIDVLRRAGVLVDMVSITADKEVTGAHEIAIVADKNIADISFEEYDGLFLPGGMPGTNNLDNCDILTEKIVEFNAAGKLLAAICAAPKVFGRLGILKGKEAICYPGFEEFLEGAKVCENAKVVKADNIFTSRGMGTALDLGLDLVAEMIGKEEAQELKKAIQYA